MRISTLFQQISSLALVGSILVVLSACGSTTPTSSSQLDPNGSKLGSEYSESIDRTAINSRNFEACQVFFGDEISTLPEVTGSFTANGSSAQIKDISKVRNVHNRISQALEKAPTTKTADHLKKLNKPFASAIEAVDKGTENITVDTSGVPTAMKALIHDCVQAGY